MEVKPVKLTEQPEYPLKEEITAEQLKTSVPQRWAVSKAAKIALGALAAVTLAGCNPPQYVPEGSPASPAGTTESSVTESPELSIFAGTPAPGTLNVAPLFEHGEGRGAFGGDMASMPAFMSENEALSIINEVAKEYDLEFSAEDTPEFKGVLQPATNIYDPENKQPSDTIITLTSDFADKEHRLAIEYVSVEDVKAWDPHYDGNKIMDTYETKDAAEQLSEALEQSYPANGSQYAAGVLYDPCESFMESSVPGEKLNQPKGLSKEHLAAQARDFFEWLRQQGII